MLSRRVLNRTVGKMKENSPTHCYNCYPCAHNGVRPGVGAVMQKEDLLKEDLIHLPVWPNPSNSLF